MLFRKRLLRYPPSFYLSIYPSFIIYTHSHIRWQAEAAERVHRIREETFVRRLGDLASTVSQLRNDRLRYFPSWPEHPKLHVLGRQERRDGGVR